MKDQYSKNYSVSRKLQECLLDIANEPLCDSDVKLGYVSRPIQCKVSINKKEFEKFDTYSELISILSMGKVLFVVVKETPCRVIGYLVGPAKYIYNVTRDLYDIRLSEIIDMLSAGVMIDASFR